MSTPILTETIMNQVQELPENMQHQVLSFIQSLKAASRQGVSGEELAKFSGVIPQPDIATIKKAIEEDCEQVDWHER